MHHWQSLAALEILTLLAVVGCYYHLRRMLRSLMSATETVDQQLEDAITRLTTDTQTAIADIATLLKQSQSDPVVAQAIQSLASLDANLTAADANIKAVISPPPAPASGQGVPASSP